MKKHRSDSETAERASRRDFLRHFGFLAGASVIPAGAFARRDSARTVSRTVSDEDLVRERFNLASRESLSDRTMGEIMVAVGVSFIGTPYAAHTLEAEGPEHLVVNLSGLDCVTFVENTLAISRCIMLRTFSFDEFRKQLQLIRYRGGAVNGYPSRLHYFSDWIQDNERKGVVRNITGEIGGIPDDRGIDFMSTHSGSYPPLSDPAILAQIREVEESLNKRPRLFLPKEKVSGHSHELQPGDVIGITTSVEGLDISHTGLAVHLNGVVRYLHAPLSGGEVQISTASLADYLMNSKSRTGIMAARPIAPS
jgi:hypothetical protein